jgi:hypothetical protein
MSSLASPIQIAATSAAMVWPLAAGATLVMWTKVRAAERRRHLAAVETGLQGLFRSVEAQPVPDRLELVVEALEEQAAVSPKITRPAPRPRRKAARAS